MITYKINDNNSLQIRSKFQTTTSPDENVTISTYRFVPSTMDGGSQLVCRAGNVRLPDSTLEDSWRLQIHCKFIYLYFKVKINPTPIHIWQILPYR